MDLTNVEEAMVSEMNRCFEGIKNTQVGSKEHVMATNDIAKLYSAMAAANHNSETVRVQAEKNEAESILKDEDQKARAELDKERLEFEKKKLEFENERADIERKSKEELEKARLAFERDRIEKELNQKYDDVRVRKDIENGKLDLESKKFENDKLRDAQAAHDKSMEHSLEVDKFALEQQRLDLEADRIRQDFALKEVQNKTNLVDIYVDGVTALAGVVVKGVIFCGAMGAILSFETTGAVTTKTFSWLGKILF